MLPAENYKMPLPVTTATLPPAIVIVTNPPSFEIQQIFVPGSLIKEDDNESLLNVVRRVSAENISEIHVTQRPLATVVVPSPEYHPPTPPPVTEMEEEQSVSHELTPSLVIPEEEDIHSLLNVIGTTSTPPSTPSSRTPSRVRRIRIIQTVPLTILLPRSPPPVLATQPPHPHTTTVASTKYQPPFPPSLVNPEKDDIQSLLNVIGTIPTPKFQQPSSRTPSPARRILQTVPPTILLPRTPPPVVSTQPPLTTTATPTKYQPSFPPPPSLVIPEEDDVHSLLNVIEMIPPPFPPSLVIPEVDDINSLLNVIEMIPTPPSTTPKSQQPSSWTPSPTRTIIQTVLPSILLPRSPMPVISTPPAPKKDDGQLLQQKVRTISAEEYQMRSTSTVSSTEPPLTTTSNAIVPPTYQPPSLPPVPSEKVEQPPLQNVVKVTSAGNYRMFSRSSTTPSTTTSYLTGPTTTSPSTSAGDEDDYYDLFNFLGVKYKMV
eukprot:GFUD01139351.1.p1 GENE.GFUD01139351.1~~GFUD01139351.1.p1  ORF type:complete len:565 (-),score=65.29 GFUD01139351.1:58-1521(-)